MIMWYVAIKKSWKQNGHYLYCQVLFLRMALQHGNYKIDSNRAEKIFTAMVI